MTAVAEKRSSGGILASVTRSVGSAGKAAAALFGGRKTKKGTRRRAKRSGAPEAVIQSGSIRETPADHVELESARVAADEGQAALAAALSDPEPAVRARALSAIVQFSERRATRLVRATLHDPDATVRRAAALAAARLDGIAIVAALLVALEDPDSGVRAAAARSIGLITGRTITLRKPDLAVSSDELDQLKSWWKEQRVAELLRDVD